MLAATHLHPWISITLAAFVALWCGWYWMRLGRAAVPRSRRNIRRTSIVLMLVSAPMFVRALSFLDPTIHQQQYIMTWTMALIMILLVLATALLDAINSLRLHRRQQHDELVRAASALAQDVKARRAEGGKDRLA